MLTQRRAAGIDRNAVRIRVARLCAWTGAIATFAYSDTKTQAQVASGHIGTLDAARGVVPLVLLVVALGLAWREWTRPTAVEWAAVAFVVVCLLSTIWSVSPRTTLLKAGVLGIAYGCLIVLTKLYRSARSAIDGLTSVLVLLTVSTLVGLVVAPGRAYKAVEGADSTRRLAGVFPQLAPNIVAVVAAATIICLLNGLGPRWLRTRFVCAGFVSAALLVLVLSRTRSALFLGAVALLISALIRVRPGRRLLTFAWVGAAAAVIAALALIGPTREFFTRGQSAVQLLSLTGRTTTWSRAVDTWENHKWLGAGYFSGHRLGVDFRYRARISSLDNTWLESLVDVGVVGTAALAVFAGVGLVSWVRAWHVDAHLASTVMALLFLGFADSFVIPTLQSPKPALLLFGFLLLVGGLQLRIARAASQSDRAHISAR